MGMKLSLLQHNLGMTEALGRYALLTIGDGLVTQIPAREAAEVEPAAVTTAPIAVVTEVRAS
jgi:flagellar biosynthesis component FlhA